MRPIPEVVTVKETELRVRLWPRVQNRVFHVTRRENIQSILTGGGIAPNPDGLLRTTFGSSEASYFRKRGCVSLFDLVHPSEDQIKERIADCWPFQTAAPDSDIAILIVKASAYGSLIRWDTVNKAGQVREMIVPYVEAGYPGLLPLCHIDQIIEVHVVAVPGSVQATRRAIEDACNP